jgi:two-component system, cell cycle sensor histidine kinase and response regulator CckA
MLLSLKSRKRAIMSSTILLVDDDPGVAQVLAWVLREKGRHTVFQAHTASDAIRMSREHELDLLLVDVRLGLSNGKQLASELLEDHPGLPVLFMSGYPISYLAEKGILNPGDALLYKPFSPDELLAQTARALAKQSAFHAQAGS